MGLQGQFKGLLRFRTATGSTHGRNRVPFGPLNVVASSNTPSGYDAERGLLGQKSLTATSNDGHDMTGFFFSEYMYVPLVTHGIGETLCAIWYFRLEFLALL